MLSEQTIPQWKKEEVKHLVDLMKNYNNIAIINVANIGDRQVQAMRKILRGDAVIRMSKKSLQARAIDKYEEESGKENLDELKENIPGQSALVFTDLDPFELKRTFIKNKWWVAAKPDTITPVDITVPAGDTGLPTGQVISELNMTLKLPTMIKNDTIWIRENKVTHKAGDLVDVKEAAVLKKLGVEPIESIIKLYMAWVDGTIYTQEVLYMDMEQFQNNFASAYSTARILAIELGFLDMETIAPLTHRAYREALALLFKMPIFDDSIVDEYVRKAHSSANLLNSMIFGGGTVAKPDQSDNIDESEKKPDEEEPDEEEPQGIGGLFG
ncbi:MAG: 50S ribosomal protein L10 [Candidatus Lokiarchaeota archaeon]|nr:50S ribosomal protein L10 [Candidatus Lokiarchaeota archaeon]MBD3200689.1 50S ribosomal protein L10 [Candidatus Lokiarchaeota archaeon]